jgi:hypothetical protein
VSQIKQKEGTGLHNSFKASTAARGLDMTVVLLEYIQSYVAKYGSTTPLKKGRLV